MHTHQHRDLKSKLAIRNYLTADLANATVAYSSVQSVMALQARMSPPDS